MKLSAGSVPARLFGLTMFFAGIAGGYYNHYLAATEGEYYIRLCVFAPLGVIGGLLMLLRPDWAGPLRSDSSRAHKTSMFVGIGLMAVISGIDMYSLNRPLAPHRFEPPRVNFSPDLSTSTR
jgi:hypothetical protein